MCYAADLKLEEALKNEGWLEFSSRRSEQILLLSARRKLQKRSISAKSIENFKYRYKEIPPKFQGSIEEILGILNLSKNYVLRVDKFLAYKLGFKQLMVSKKIDKHLVAYITSSRGNIAYLRVLFGGSSVKNLIRVLRVQINGKENTSLTGDYSLKFVNAPKSKILRPYVVTSTQNKYFLINSEPSMPQISKRIGLDSHIYSKHISEVRLPHFRELEINTAHYPFSRKEELFFHALHWTFPKVMKAIEHMQEEERSILLINEDLNKRIRDELINFANKKLGVERVQLIDYSYVLNVENLRLYSAEYQSKNGTYIYQSKSELINSFESIFSCKSNERIALKGKNILLLRDENARSTANRVIFNWAEIQNLLLSRNFTLIDLGKLSLFQQIQAYREAKVVIGLHGGHFSQMFNADINTKIIEIFAGLQSRCFQDMANQYQLDYFSIEAEKHKDSWYLDPGKLLQVMEYISP